MILGKLSQYYDRLRVEETGAPPFGYSIENIHCVLEIDEDGTPVRITSIMVEQEVESRRGVKTVSLPRRLVVPTTTQTDVRSSGKAPNFSWDNSKYVCGVSAKGKLTQDYFDEFRNHNLRIITQSGGGALFAYRKYLQSWDPPNLACLPGSEAVLTSKQDANLVFKLTSSLRFLHEEDDVKALWHDTLTELEATYHVFGKGRRARAQKGVSLLSGESSQVSKVHRKIRGGWATTGNSLVAFNDEAYWSYNRVYNRNAPMSVEESFKYTTALNWLLKKQAVTIGDTTVLYWAEHHTPMETFFGFVLNPSRDETPTQEVRAFLEAARQGGRPQEPSENTRFFVLGLAPNAARLSVRFWYDGTTGEMGQRLGRHFADIAVEKQWKEKEPDFPPVWRLLLETAAQHDSKNIPPLLAGAVLRSILNGHSYPNNLLSLLIMRCRAGDDIGYFKASLIKGCLVRNFNHPKEGLMSLDRENKTPAYLLGRLFAILEKAQKDAVPGANATIKDRYYGSASATPRSVFPVLLRNAQHHISKAEYGRFTDSQIEEVVQDLSDFPAHLDLQQQGLFAMGYYHQRNENCRKKSRKEAA